MDIMDKHKVSPPLTLTDDEIRKLFPSMPFGSDVTVKPYKFKGYRAGLSSRQEYYRCKLNRFIYWLKKDGYDVGDYL